jgi:hypothetical protein
MSDITAGSKAKSNEEWRAVLSPAQVSDTTHDYVILDLLIRFL